MLKRNHVFFAILSLVKTAFGFNSEVTFTHISGEARTVREVERDRKYEGEIF